ncbi:MAG: HupE/UreJ family protein [Akkermansiaceae bacterium]|nr:HupE/UreJ family protein [Verrucomicrobiales bacterium]
MKTIIRKLYLACLLFSLSEAALRAHDPFEGSSRIKVFEDGMQLVVTLGYDAGREFLVKIGISPRELTTLTREGAENSVTNFQAITSRLFELKAGTTLLSTTNLHVSSGISEVVFTSNYPRPPAGPLHVRALFFEHVDDIREGYCLVLGIDETLGTALMSRKHYSLSVTVPPVGKAVAAGLNDTPGPMTTSLSALASEQAETPPARPSFGEFLKLGVEHILTGFDHLLFLAALLIGVRKLRAMLVIITCFTIAHSLTLALAALGLATISPRVIEPLIAVSIIVVAVENLVRKEAVADRYWMAGGFGLIHGFGFATVLRETGLGTGAAMAMPLFSFNLGVEIGQVLVAAVALPLLFKLRERPTFSRFALPAVSFAVIAVSGYWFVERAVFGR